MNPSQAAERRIEPGPELALLLACVSAQRDDHAVAAALERGLDADRLRRLLAVHRLLPALVDALQCHGWEGLPDDLRVDLLEQRATHDARCSRQADEMLAVSDALAAAGVPSLVFKGPLLGALAYGDIAARQSADLDVLVAREKHGVAASLLERRGYRNKLVLSKAERRAFDHYHFADTFERPGTDLVVDLHWRMLPSTWCPPLDTAALWDAAIDVPFQGGVVHTAGPEDQLLLAALHGAKVRWPRLRLVRDVAQILDRFPELDGDAVLRRATAQGCRRVVLLAVDLAVALGGAHPPQALCTAAVADPAVPELRRWVTGRVAFEHYQRGPIFQLSWFRWRVLDRWRDRVGYVARTVVTPRVEHVRQFRLPASCFWFNFPLKVLHDTVVLPLWLAWKHLTGKRA